MGRLTIEVTASQVDQGGSVDGRVVVDPGGVPLAGLHLRMIAPPAGFEHPVTIAPVVAAGPDDGFAVEDPSGAAGIIDVVAAPAAPLQGTQELFTFGCRAVGLRGQAYRLRVLCVEAFDDHGMRVELTPSAVEVMVSSGQAAILPVALPGAETGVPYLGVLAAQGGQPPYTWQVTGGSLPPGLALRPGGVIDGTPTQAGSFAFTGSLADAGPNPAVASSFTLTVLPEPPRIVTDSLPVAVSGRAYSALLQASGGVGAAVWTAEGLPPGLFLQQARITGTVSADRGVCGIHAVRVTAHESGAAGRAAERSLDLSVMPAPAADVSIAEPGPLVVGRDLYVTTFDVDIGVSAYVPEMDNETRTTLEDARDDLITDIAGFFGPTLPGDEPTGPALPGEEPGSRPRQPGVVDPVPGEDPPRTGGGLSERERVREVLGALLDEYRRIDEWLTDTTQASAFVEVWIDGTLVKTHAPAWLRTQGRRERARMHPTRLAVYRKALRRTRRWRRVAELFGEGSKRRDLMRRATRHLHEHLVAVRSRPGVRQIGRETGGPDLAAEGGLAGARYFGAPGTPPGGSLDPFDPIRDALDQAARWFREWLDDLLFPPAVVDGDSPLLTPGAHRVKVKVERWAVSFQHDPFDSAAAAGAQVVATVRIRPRNREGWPRLAEGLVWSSGAVTDSKEETFVADLARSGLDVVCATPAGLQILAATGDASSPYAPPQAFSCALGLAPTRLAAGRQDDIGRSALVAVRDGDVRIAVNQGVGGFRRHALQRPAGAAPVGAVCFGPVDGHGWSKLVLMCPRAVEVVANLGGALLDPPGQLTVTATAVRSFIAYDRCTSLAYYRDPLGADFVALAFFMAGTLQVYPLGADGRLGNAVRLPGFDTIDHRRQVIALRIARLVPGRTFLVAGLRQGRALVPFEITASGLASRPGTTLPVRLRDAAVGPGDGGGLAATLEPDGAALWAWWPDASSAPRWLPLTVDGGVQGIAGADGVLAVAMGNSGTIRVFVRD